MSRFCPAKKPLIILYDGAGVMEEHNPDETFSPREDADGGGAGGAGAIRSGQSPDAGASPDRPGAPQPGPFAREVQDIANKVATGSKGFRQAWISDVYREWVLRRQAEADDALLARDAADEFDRLSKEQDDIFERYKGAGFSEALEADDWQALPAAIRADADLYQRLDDEFAAIERQKDDFDEETQDFAIYERLTDRQNEIESEQGQIESRWADNIGNLTAKKLRDLADRVERDAQRLREIEQRLAADDELFALRGRSGRMPGDDQAGTGNLDERGAAAADGRVDQGAAPEGTPAPEFAEASEPAAAIASRRRLTDRATGRRFTKPQALNEIMLLGEQQRIGAAVEHTRLAYEARRGKPARLPIPDYDGFGARVAERYGFAPASPRAPAPSTPSNPEPKPKGDSLI